MLGQSIKESITFRLSPSLWRNICKGICVSATNHCLNHIIFLCIIIMCWLFILQSHNKVIGVIHYIYNRNISKCFILIKLGIQLYNYLWCYSQRITFHWSGYITTGRSIVSGIQDKGPKPFSAILNGISLQTTVSWHATHERIGDEKLNRITCIS